MTWSVTIGDRPTPVLVEVLQCQSIFRRLTPLQRTAVLNPKTSMHPLTRRALVAHGLWEGDGLTETGRLVAKWNQPKDKP